MKRCVRFLVFPLCAALAAWIAFSSCGKDFSPTGPKENKNVGSVKGTVTYPGGKDFSGITVTLEKTTGEAGRLRDIQHDGYGDLSGQQLYGWCSWIVSVERGCSVPVHSGLFAGYTVMVSARSDPMDTYFSGVSTNSAIRAR